MKKFLEFAGFCAFGLALVGFILMMATPAVVTKDADALLSGTGAIFGGEYADPVVLALLAWIFGLLGILVLCAVLVLPLLKIKVLDKFAGFIAFGLCLLFVLVGVFMFCVRASANADSMFNIGYIGAGWVIGGILFVLAGLVVALPGLMKLLKK